VVRAAVAAFLAREPDLEVVGEVAEAGQLFEAIETLKPDLLLLDAHMPDHKVIRSAEMLCKQHPDMRILVLSAYDRREYVVGLLQAGASGYVLKDDAPETLVRAIRAVAQGEEWVSPRVAKTLLQTARDNGKEEASKLTPREMEVLRLMANGSRNEEIAESLFVTVQTVKNHIRNIFRKLEVETRVEAVLYAINQGLVTVTDEGSEEKPP
jgi:DNA-binding NarL/FixJ family response regulator